MIAQQWGARPFVPRIVISDLFADVRFIPKAEMEYVQFPRKRKPPAISTQKWRRY
jgi:hypothetical protein